VHAACTTEWLSAGSIQKMVVVIKGVESGDTLERWVFNIETDKAVTTSGYERLSTRASAIAAYVCAVQARRRA
jgi:F420-dependent methylenetetrahydromethanopterin dehydrogenase